MLNLILKAEEGPHLVCADLDTCQKLVRQAMFGIYICVQSVNVNSEEHGSGRDSKVRIVFTNSYVSLLLRQGIQKTVNIFSDST